MLVLQISLPIALFCDGPPALSIRLQGGTNAAMVRLFAVVRSRFRCFSLCSAHSFAKFHFRFCCVPLIRRHPWTFSPECWRLHSVGIVGSTHS